MTGVAGSSPCPLLPIQYLRGRFSHALAAASDLASIESSSATVCPEFSVDSVTTSSLELGMERDRKVVIAAIMASVPS